MYRLLIVDDEPIITDGLYSLFEDIREPEFDLYKAYSGTEALAVMQQAKIDILLTDICMPDMTGLELQSEVRRQWPRCKVIFLTGFNDFAFIQQAVRNDSIDYILKTEGDEPILRAVGSAVAGIDKELSDWQYLQKVQDDRRQYAAILAGRLLQDIVRGAPYSDEERAAQFAELGIPMNPAGPVLLLLGACGRWDEDASLTGRLRTLLAIGEAGQAILSESVMAVPAAINNNYILWFIQPQCWPEPAREQECWRKLTLFVHGCMDSLQAASRQGIDAPLMLIAASAPVGWEGTGRKFDSMKAMLIKAGSLSKEALVIDPAYPDDGQAEALSSPDMLRVLIKRASQFKSILENGQKEDCRRLLDEVAGAVCGANGLQSGVVRELYFALALPLLSFINENGLGCIIGAQSGLDALTNLNAHCCWEDAVTYLSALCAGIFRHSRDEGTNNADRILRFVQRYVSDNIGDDLSLTKISGLLHFNPSYFSRMFKSVTDMGYMEYVAGVKTARAKELLAHGSMGVHEIAIRLGFDAPSNFSRFFKKQANLSPQEYRDSVQMKNGAM